MQENDLKEECLYNGYYIKNFCKHSETGEKYILFKYIKNSTIKYIVPLNKFLKKGFSIKKPKENKKCERIIYCEKVYVHFKGNNYYIKDIAINPFTGETFVIYQALYGEGKTYIREYNMFCEKIDTNRIDNITKQNYRFELSKNY